jgi:hypothetical protein
MAALTSLQVQAELSCHFRNHKMGKWNVNHGESRSLSDATCVRCGAWVQCNSKPMPNEIEIGGPALAKQCSKTNEDLIQEAAYAIDEACRHMEQNQTVQVEWYLRAAQKKLQAADVLPQQFEIVPN